MLSIEKCEQILSSCSTKYSKEEIKKIRELLYKVGELDYTMTKTRESNFGVIKHFDQD